MQQSQNPEGLTTPIKHGETVQINTSSTLHESAQSTNETHNTYYQHLSEAEEKKEITDHFSYPKVYKSKILDVEIPTNYKKVNEQFDRFKDPKFHGKAWGKYEMKELSTNPLILDLSRHVGKENSYFQLECTKDEYSVSKRRVQFDILSFKILYESATVRRTYITSQDLGYDLQFNFIYKIQQSKQDANKTRYVVKIVIDNQNNNVKRNIALETIECFAQIAKEHGKYMITKFKWLSIQAVEALINVREKIVNTPEVIASLTQAVKTLGVAIDSLTYDNDRFIKFEKYTLPAGSRLPKKASQVGHGFSTTAGYELAKTLIHGELAKLNFIRYSSEDQDQYLSFLPNGEKWHTVKNVVAPNWFKDDYFVHEVFNGVNPYTVQAVKNINQIRGEFSQVKNSDGELVNLEQLIQNGDLFVCTYPQLRNFSYPNIPKAELRAFVVYEPEFIFSVVDGRSQIIGIGFFFGANDAQGNGTDFQVYTPKGYTYNNLTTPKGVWTLAKMHALCADSQIHEIIKHLGLGHILGETFAIAHHDTYYYKQNGDLNKTGGFLAPHFKDLIAINSVARETFITQINNTLSDFFGIDGKTFPALFSTFYTKENDIFNTHVGFEEELAHRGFDRNFKHINKYRFLKDGFKVNDALKEYVHSVVAAFYPTQESIDKDAQLQQFFKYIYEEKNGDIRGFPKDGYTQAKIADVFTRIIWQVSAYHSALNFSQAQSYGYAPMRSVGLRQTIPKLSELNNKSKNIENGDVTNQFIQDTLPTNLQTFENLDIAGLLTTRTVPTYTNMFSPFAHYRQDQNDGIPEADKAFHILKKRFHEIDEEIAAENANVTPGNYPYIHLMPSRIDNSLSI